MPFMGLYRNISYLVGLSHIGLISCTVSIIDIATMYMLYCYYYYNNTIDEVSCGGLVVYVWRYLGDTLRRAVCVCCVFSFVFSIMGTLLIKLI